MLGFEETPEERLFKAALGFARGEREAFIRESAGGDDALVEAVQELLTGYEREGGDGAGETMSEKPSARERWAVSTEEAGTVIAPFTLVRRVGEGGMGTVWEAEQSAPIGRRVALKVIKMGMDTAEVVKRFERERKTLAVMEHPNIAAVFEAGATELGRPFFAMEFVEGEPITAYAARMDLNIGQRLLLVAAVCAGVSHAHQKGVIHRDLKPSNILVNADGVPKIIDFGIAKAAEDEGGTLFTRESQMLGTPAYMSPEQVVGNTAAVDTRSDVYSLGVILYELLSGVPPFDPRRLESATVSQMENILTGEDPSPPSVRGLQEVARNPEKKPLKYGKDLDWIVMKALAKEPARRYQSVERLREDIHRYMEGEVVLAVPPSLLYRFTKFVRRHQGAAVLAGLAVFVLLLGLAWEYYQFRNARAESWRLAGERSSRADGLAREGKPLVAALWHTLAAEAAEGHPTLKREELESAARLTSDTVVPVFASRLDSFDVSGFCFGPTGRYLIVEDRDGRERMLDLTTGSKVAFGGNSRFDALAFSPDGRRVACVAAGEGRVELWPFPRGGERLGMGKISKRKHPDLSTLAFDAAGTRLAVAARDELFVLPIEVDGSLKISPVRYEFDSDIARLRFCPEKPSIIGITGRRRDFTLLEFDIEAGTTEELIPLSQRWLPFQATDSILPPVFSSDGRLFVPCVRPNGGWYIYATDPFLEIGVEERAPMQLLATNPEATLGLVRSEGRLDNLRVVDFGPEGKFVSEVGLSGVVTCAAFSLDSTQAVAGDVLGNIQILSKSPEGWAATTRLRSDLADTVGGVTAIAFSPDGKFIISSHYQGQEQDWSLLRIWRLPQSDSQPLTAAEMSLDLAMLNASTTLTRFGSAVPIPAAEWWLRWENFEREHPGFHKEMLTFHPRKSQ